MRPHITLIVMVLGAGTLLLLTRWWQEYDYQQRLRARRTPTMNSLKQLSIAMHNYAEDHGRRFPPRAIFSPDGKLLLSWRVALLPYLEQADLYRSFHLDEPWDSPHNLTLLPEMPSLFESLPDHKTRMPHKTFFQVLVGPGAAFEGDKGMRLPGDFPDGTSNTILIAESAHAVEWTAPKDLTCAPDRPLPPLGVPGRDFFLIALADASVRSVPTKKRMDIDKASEEAIRAAITRNGRENSSLDDR